MIHVSQYSRILTSNKNNNSNTLNAKYLQGENNKTGLKNYICSTSYMFIFQKFSFLSLDTNDHIPGPRFTKIRKSYEFVRPIE